ncbi:MAG: RDD family protein [Nostocoides sp.]
MSSTKPPPAPLGLPADGPGSLAGLGRRILAVVIDWVLSTLVATLVFKVPYGSTGPGAFAPLAVFAVENFVLVATLGSTVGHRLLGMRVGALGRATLTPGQALIRTVLLCLFIPAAIWGKDGRGLHDRAAGTVLVRR